MMASVHGAQELQGGIWAPTRNCPPTEALLCPTVSRSQPTSSSLLPKPVTAPKLVVRWGSMAAAGLLLRSARGGVGQLQRQWTRGAGAPLYSDESTRGWTQGATIPISSTFTGFLEELLRSRGEKNSGEDPHVRDSRRERWRRADGTVVCGAHMTESAARRGYCCVWGPHDRKRVNVVLGSWATDPAGPHVGAEWPSRAGVVVWPGGPARFSLRLVFFLSFIFSFSVLYSFFFPF
jgi:hypothetical protein